MFRKASSHDVPAHRITRARRQGERYFADGLRELPDSRRLAILAVCAVEWGLFLADAVVETHDRIVGRTYREAARTCEGQLGDETAAVREALRAFADLGTALIGARDTGEALDVVTADGPGWEGLGDLVARAAALANTGRVGPVEPRVGRLQPLPPLHAANAAPLSRASRLAPAASSVRMTPVLFRASGPSRFSSQPLAIAA